MGEPVLSNRFDQEELSAILVNGRDYGVHFRGNMAQF